MSTLIETTGTSAPPKRRGKVLFYRDAGAARAWARRLLSVVAAVLPLLGVLGVVAAVNLPTLNDYFHGDDYLAFIDLTTRPALKHMGEVIAFKDADVYWRPLGEVFYLAIYSLFGLDVAAFHMANIGVFLLTLVLLYKFCLRAGFNRPIALGAAAMFGLYPNHVVSVAWVTNGPRLMAVMFGLLSLICLQEAIRSRNPNSRSRDLPVSVAPVSDSRIPGVTPSGRRGATYEVLAFVAFLLAAFSDEVALSLAPLAVLYGLAVEREGTRPFVRQEGWLRRALWRSAPYGLALAVLVPAQFIFGTKDDAGFTSLGFGPHMASHFWALAAKLVLPVKDGVAFSAIPGGVWAAGAVAGVLALPMLALGSDRLRFLVVWTVLGLAPFTLWMTPIAPARYVYIAAVPFAIIVSWACVSAAEWVISPRRWRGRPWRGDVTSSQRPLNVAAVGLLIVVAALLGGVFWQMTVDRNAAFARDSETYRILARGLPEALPAIPEHSRVVIYYGIWTGFYVWSDAVIQTTYRDRTLSILNVPRGQVEAASPRRRPTDMIVYYTGNGFIAAAPLRQATTQ